MVASQGFEPQYAESESAVLPLNDEAMREDTYIGSAVWALAESRAEANNFSIIRARGMPGQFPAGKVARGS